MKRLSILVVAALVAALAAVTMVGCGGQQASSSSASDAASASTAAAQTQEELIAEFKDAVANAPEFKSVTIAAEDTATFTDDDSKETETITENTVYKFDASGEKLRTSAETEVDGSKLAYYTEGDDVVFVSDGSAYSGTTEQFYTSTADGVQAFLTGNIGDLNTLADCVDSIEKLETHGLTAYTLWLDPQKYIASDEALKTLADYGDPVKKAVTTVTFEEDGSIAAIDQTVTYEASEKYLGMLFSDYDGTTVDPLPAADKTYEDMEADMLMEFEDLEEDAAE